ncbi:Stress-induced-phosphoprotein 1 [Portunus trituberculatus]|uniref:Stress-induced-phosphoprotein 1 n=1 Tax=Portunus trituberculatus TaxID=210409 RepID=A0A5B7FGQ4_PORTR|nr:Stress-induced-phosphoprotein 1 [Portunus trituberculatus]
MHDKRLLTCISVMMGLDVIGADDEAEMEDASETTTSNASSKNTPSPRAQKEEKMDVDKTPEQISAMKEKEAGNAAYKKKDFETALTHYSKAIELDPTDMTFLNNKAAVFFEQQKYQECISTCEKAVEVGRENRADFKLISKAFTRTGNAYKALKGLKQYSKAQDAYQKAIDIDPNCQDALDGFRECMMSMNSDPEEVGGEEMQGE